jgi:hypothetical protein
VALKTCHTKTSFAISLRQSKRQTVNFDVKLTNCWGAVGIVCRRTNVYITNLDLDLRAITTVVVFPQ